MMIDYNSVLANNSQSHNKHNPLDYLECPNKFRGTPAVFKGKPCGRLRCPVEKCRDNYSLRRRAKCFKQGQISALEYHVILKNYDKPKSILECAEKFRNAIKRESDIPLIFVWQFEQRGKSKKSIPHIHMLINDVGIPRERLTQLWKNACRLKLTKSKGFREQNCRITWVKFRKDAKANVRYIFKRDPFRASDDFAGKRLWGSSKNFFTNNKQHSEHLSRLSDSQNRP